MNKLLKEFISLVLEQEEEYNIDTLDGIHKMFYDYSERKRLPLIFAMKYMGPDHGKALDAIWHKGSKDKYIRMYIMEELGFREEYNAFNKAYHKLHDKYFFYRNFLFEIQNLVMTLNKIKQSKKSSDPREPDQQVVTLFSHDSPYKTHRNSFGIAKLHPNLRYPKSYQEEFFKENEELITDVRELLDEMEDWQRNAEKPFFNLTENHVFELLNELANKLVEAKKQMEPFPENEDEAILKEFPSLYQLILKSDWMK